MPSTRLLACRPDLLQRRPSVNIIVRTITKMPSANLKEVSSATGKSSVQHDGRWRRDSSSDLMFPFAEFDNVVRGLRQGQACMVDFHAVWCGPCHMIRPTYEKLAEQVSVTRSKVAGQV
jgi:thiol-disulfide isomerase/thioredoxin